MSDYPLINSDLSKGDLLDDLLDVSVSSPTDGQVLTYDSTKLPNEPWIAADGGGDIVRKSDVFTGTTDTVYPLSNAICAAGNLNVYLNGTKLIFGTNFTHDATANTFTLNTPVKSISDVVEAETWKVQ